MSTVPKKEWLNKSPHYQIAGSRLESESEDQRAAGTDCQNIHEADVLEPDSYMEVYQHRAAKAQMD
ncbi:MAG: hypothetical protein QM296_13710 [Bacillota bacterium]|nr:hypothetical protein [Bacillota bacterium]